MELAKTWSYSGARTRYGRSDDFELGARRSRAWRARPCRGCAGRGLRSPAGTSGWRPAACRSRRPGPLRTARGRWGSRARRRARAAAPAAVVQRVEEVGGELDAGVVDAPPPRAVGLVGLHDARVAQADLLAVDRDLGARLGVGDLVGELLGLLAHEAVDAQVEQEREAAALVVAGGGVVQPAQRAHRCRA